MWPSVAVRPDDIAVDEKARTLKIRNSQPIPLDRIRELSVLHAQGAPFHLNLALRGSGGGITNLVLESRNSTDQCETFLRIYRILRTYAPTHRRPHKTGAFYVWPSLEPVHLSLTPPCHLTIGTETLNMDCARLHVFVGRKHPATQNSMIPKRANDDDVVFSLMVDLPGSPPSSSSSSSSSSPSPSSSSGDMGKSSLKEKKISRRTYHFRAIDAATRTAWLQALHAFVIHTGCSTRRLDYRGTTPTGGGTSLD